MDGAMTKAPWVGKKTGKNPTDRGKLGVKRSTLIDGRGVPLAVAVEGANVPDQKLVAATLDAIPVDAPIPLPKSRSIFASIKAMPANRLTAKPANAAIRLTFPRLTKSQSRSIVGRLGGGKSNALIPGSTATGGYSSAGKKRLSITSASCTFSSPSSLYEPRRFSDRLLA